jgi:hypothetical protein
VSDIDDDDSSVDAADLEEDEELDSDDSSSNDGAGSSEEEEDGDEDLSKADRHLEDRQNSDYYLLKQVGKKFTVDGVVWTVVDNVDEDNVGHAPAPGMMAFPRFSLVHVTDPDTGDRRRAHTMGPPQPGPARGGDDDDEEEEEEKEEDQDAEEEDNGDALPNNWELSPHPAVGGGGFFINRVTFNVAWKKPVGNVVGIASYYSVTYDDDT